LSSMNGAGLFEVLKRRHACRHFEQKPIPDEILDKLIYAAHRAPTAGNIPYRFLVVVKNPARLKIIKTISPGYLGESSAAIVICTNLKAQPEMSRVDIDECARYDAGAAAENIALASYALGLGSNFIKSYHENALRRVLELPEHCRPELMISLGYPAGDEVKPLKKREMDKITYFEKYGFEVRKTASDLNSLKNSNTLEEQLFELVLFLLTAAQESTTEPRVYPTLRLLDAVRRIADLHSKTQLIEPDEFLI